MNYCLICNSEFVNIDLHIERYHRLKPKKVNKGIFYCPLCKVKVDNKQMHYCSNLHRINMRKDEANSTYGLKEYKIHFDKYCNETEIKALESKKLKKQDPFWLAAKQDLIEKDYRKLKEYANGGRKKIRRYRRHQRIHRYTRHFKPK